MSEDKWWGKPEEKESSKETIEEMINHTEMMKIKREEEMARLNDKLHQNFHNHKDFLDKLKIIARCSPDARFILQ